MVRAWTGGARAMRKAKTHKPARPQTKRATCGVVTTADTRTRGYTWQQIRKAILARDGYLCQCADCALLMVPLIAEEVDHIVPLCQGGTDEPHNLRAIAKRCHRIKSAKERWER